MGWNEELRQTMAAPGFNSSHSMRIPPFLCSSGEQVDDELVHSLAGVEVFFEQRLDFAGDDFPIPRLGRRVAVGRTKEAVTDAESGAKVALLFNHHIQRTNAFA